ncbi:nuclear pore membrane glycoprotein 210 [Cephus cinctus]|uniref:Nuclear pore membrane glycoprotein 210 n=1 Tax=Cephus cinctus TaxID=211228 RepID=A0AAJ7C3P3_CEPCN|nr:nuclear pore membrane glycoprotein 210 [Cephus cinctus]
MAGSEALLKIIVFTICAAAINVTIVVEGHRLNVPRVLLPVFNDYPVNFTLEVTEGGCYQWSTSRLDIIRLVPINENLDRTCSSAVIVQTVTKEFTRNTAIVLAEDVASGLVLRCDVIVDAISSLHVVTTTRELFIEEAPEAFEVRACDEQGNEFTTLAGVEFTWTVGNIDKHSTTVDKKAPNNVLRFMTFQESPYETPHTVSSLDAIGKRGHIILLEGVRTGTAKVSVRLLHPEYKHVSPIEVELIVVANLIILPSDVTIMVHDSFKYKVMQVRQGRLEEINFPSSQYYLEAENTAILEIDNEHSSIYALSYGKTKIFLHDKYVHEEYGVVLPSATVNVNDVAYIALTVLPDRNWALILGKVHEIVIELYDNKDRRFHIGEGVEATMQIDGKYFNTHSVTPNGTHVIGVPINIGTTTVEATLHGVINKYGKRVTLLSKLSTRAELTIHSPVTVHPKILAMPWDPRGKSRIEIALKVTGGDGSYVWTSRQPSVATVTQNGVVRILQKGTTDISVSMARNQYNKDTTKVHVLPPCKLEIVRYNMEAAVGEPIYLHIALYGELSDGTDVIVMPFNDCKDVPFEVDIPDENFKQVYENETVQPVGIACTTIAVMGLDVGTSSISVAYKVNGLYLIDNITVSAYEPLTALHPASMETLLTVGSSRKILFKGGPHPWSIKPQGYSREARVSDNMVIESHEYAYSTSGFSDVALFEVTCKALGEANFIYTVSNLPLLPNCQKTEAVAKVRVICGKPRYIYLQPKFSNSSSCPIGQVSEKIMARNNNDLDLTVVIKDEDGRRFDNISSLHIEWELTPTGVGILDAPIGSKEETITDMNVEFPKRHYQRIIPKKHTGSLTVSASVIGYQKNILNKLGITPEWPVFPTENERGIVDTPMIEASVNVILVNDTTITPSTLKVLNDPNGKYFLQVSQGSGYYEFLLSTDDIADVRYIEPTKSISVTPKKSGVLQIALVDLCIDSGPAQATIEVQQLGGIEVETVNKVEKGKCIVAAVKLFDTNGQLIQLPSIDALNIRAETENGYIEVKRLPINEQGKLPYEQILYVIHGIEEGDSQLIFVSGEGDQEIESDPCIVQVFLPLRVTPRNLTVLIGTPYQIKTEGGPTNAEVEFTAENDDVLSIDRTGVLEGMAMGKTKVIARAVGLSAKGTRVLYSQDHAEVHVIILEGIKIVTPTSRVKAGAVIPLWAFGLPEHLTPLIIGSLRKPLRFIWMSSDSNSLSLHNMYEGTGINVRYQNEVTLHAKAIRPGTVTVYLNVTAPSKTLPGYKKDVTFTTFVKIEIFEELYLTNPVAAPGVSIILMAANSILKLETNRDKRGVTSYKILSSGQSNESEELNALTTGSKAISVDKNGVIRAGDHFGRTVISISSVEGYSFKQTLTIIVDVKPVHYVMLSLKSNVRIRSGEELNMLPNGMELDYELQYYDSVGSKFHSAETKFQVTANRGDLVSFAPGKGNVIATKFLKNGELVAKVYDEKYPNGMFDYVHMAIGDILFPIKTTLTVGDIVCFSMPLLSSDGDPGYWQSSAPDNLTVDPLTGIGRARSPGHAIVKHSLATPIQGDIEVTIKPIAKISLVPLRGKNITGMEVFSLPLVLKSKDEKIKENNVLSRGLGGCRRQSSFAVTSFPFTCNIQFVSPVSTIAINDLFLVKPRFDIVTGFYYCDVMSMGPLSIALSTMETSVLINAQSNDIEGTPVEVVYLPPMYVTKKEIVFVLSSSNTLSTATIDIYGLKTVLNRVTMNAPEGLTVSGPQFVSKHLIQYKIRLLQNREEMQGQKVIVTNELTNQSVPLLIRISKYDQFVPISGIHWLDYMYYYRYTLAPLVVLVVTFFFIFKHKVTCIPVRNKTVFADTCPPPIKNANVTCSPTVNNATSTPNSRSPNSSLRPFSAFEPVYGDPRGFYTPTARRNRTLHSP